MRIRKIAAVFTLGAMMTFTTAVGTAFAAPWTCPYGHDYCPGQEYCDAHVNCVADGYCIHDYCENGVHGENCVNYGCARPATTTRTSATVRTATTSYSGGGCHGGGHGHHHGR